jgi:hypothetical protein
MTKHNFAHNDHLDQGGDHASQGGGKTRKNGSHLEQATSGGAGFQRTPPSEKGGKLSGTPGLVEQGPSRRDGQDHLRPHPAMTDQTPDRGGSRSLVGVSNRTFAGGPARSGSHLAAQPGLQGRKSGHITSYYEAKPSKKVK